MSPEMSDHPFRVHIAYKLVPCHRTAADAFQRAVKAATACLEGGIDLGFAIMRRRMQMYADDMTGQLPDKIVRHGKDLFGRSQPNRIGKGLDPDTQATEGGGPFIDDFLRPGIAIGIAEPHREVNHQLFFRFRTELLHLFDGCKRALNGLIGIS